MSLRGMAAGAGPKWLAALAGMCLIAAGWSLIERASGDRTSARGTVSTPAGASPWDAAYFPNPMLTDQHGRRHRFYDDLLAGKTVAINTFFTVCADICPLGTAKMPWRWCCIGCCACS